MQFCVPLKGDSLRISTRSNRKTLRSALQKADSSIGATCDPRVDGENMASFPDLRPNRRSAKAESTAAPRVRARLLLAVSTALLLPASLAVSELATLRGAKAHDASVFLTRELGPPLDRAPLVRTPAPTINVGLVRSGGLTVARKGGGKLTLATRGSGRDQWRHFTHGATRTTPFGSETVTVGPGQAEQYLTVAKRHGTRTWEWNLGTNLNPEPRSNGSVDLFESSRSTPEFQILPVRILDREGKSITPAGLRWKLQKRGHSWKLRLQLDDSGLPLPYVIDPAIVFDVASGAGVNATNTITWNHTVANQPNRMLLVSYNSENTGTASCQPSSVTYNGVAMTLAGQVLANTPSPNWDCVGIYYLLNPANGTHAVSITFTAAPVNDGIAAAAMSIYSVAQTAPDVVATSQAAGLTSTNITTLWPNSWVVDAMGPGDLLGTMAVSAGQTLRKSQDSTGTNSIGMSSKLLAAAGSTTMSWTRAPAPNRTGQVVVALSPLDNTAPTAPVLSVSEASPLSFVSGTTLYYNAQGANTAGFTVDATSTDADSGIQKINFPAVAGMAGGGDDLTSPYLGAYTWNAATAASRAQTVTVTNGQGLTSTGTFTVTKDATNPTGSLTAPASSANVRGNAVVVSSNSADGGSGVGDATFQRSAGGAGVWTTIGAADTTSPYSVNWDTTALVDGLYDLRVITTDNVGNTLTSALVTNVRVDNTLPTNAVSLSSITPSGSAFQSGSTVYYRGAAAGNLQLLNAVSDAGSAPASSVFPALGGTAGTWTHTTQTINTPAGGPYLTTNNFAWNAGETNSPTESVTSTDTAGNTSNATVLTFTNDSTAPSVTVPSVGPGYYTSLSVPVTLNGGSDGASGVASGSSVVQRDDATLSAGSCGSFSGSWTTLTLSAGNDTSVQNGKCYEYRERLTDNVGNVGASSASGIAKVDSAGPSNALTLTSISPAGSVLKSGNTIYYRGAQTGGGSFKIRNAVSDPESGATSSQTAALGGSGTGWTHTPSTVATPAGGPFDSNDFVWSQGTTSAPTEVVTGRDGATNATASATLTFANDSNDPTGGALTVNATAASGGGSGSYDSDGNFTIGTRTDYSETQTATESGLASSTLVRTSASFSSADVCGAFGSPTTIIGNPAQNGLATGCYRYTLTGTDNVGNTTPIQTTVKVDPSDPSAPTLSFSALGGGAYYPGSGTRVYFKPNAANGTFDLTASSSDSDTGIASYGFLAGAALGSNWSGSGSGATRTYSYTATATSSGTQSVSAANNAGRSASSSFDPTADSSAPTGGALTVNATAASGGGSGSYDNDGNFTIGTRTDYSETQTATESGLASSTLVRTSASFSSTDVCGAFGSPTTIIGNPAQNGLATGCYRYTLTGTDNVGNTTSIQTTVKVDTSDPTGPTLSFSALGGGAYYPGSGTRVYFKPNAANGTFDLTASSSDSDTGIASYGFPAGAALGSNWSGSGSGATRTYSYTATATSSGSQSVSANNNAGRSASSSFDPTADSSAPTGGALTVNATAASGGGSESYDSDGNFTIGTRTDYSETQTATESGLASSTLVRTSASFSSTDVCGAFGSPTTIIGNPAQNGLATGCYRYTLTGTDNVGNTASIQTTVKIDTSDPSAPTLSFSALGGGAYYPGSGTRVYFKPNAANGTFDLTASSSDSDTGIASYGFPAGASLGSNWSGSGSGATRTYSYTATATSSGTQSVSATNNAGRSASSSFDPTADSSA